MPCLNVGQIMHLFLSAIFLLSQYTQVAHNWVLHQNENLGYTYFGPKNMETKEKVLPTSTGNVNYYVTYANGYGEDSTMAYMISYYRQPTPNDLIQDALLETIDASVQSVNGQLDYKNEEISDGCPTYLWRISYGEGKARIKSKIIYHKEHFIIVQVLYPSEKTNHANIQAFLESFRIHS